MSDADYQKILDDKVDKLGQNGEGRHWFVATKNTLKPLMKRGIVTSVSDGNIGVQNGNSSNYGYTFDTGNGEVYTFVTKSTINDINGIGTDVILHEGRHQIDLLAGITDQTTLELNAYGVNIANPTNSSSVQSAIHGLVNDPTIDQSRVTNFLDNKFGTGNWHP